MKVLIACEFSGNVRDEFCKLGHDAWSCDIQETSRGGKHLKCNIFDVIDAGGWDLMIAHPPCTHLAVSGAAWFKYKEKEQVDALVFVKRLMNADIPMIAIENPVSVISTYIRKPDQIIQPYHFGHMERKTTCLWLKNLPKLIHETELKKDVEKLPKRNQNPLHYLPPGKDRANIRSVTYTGIARAMAKQWGNLI
jgi:hypothetical protein